MRCYEVAKALTPANKLGKSHHCSMAIRKSKIVAIGVNDYCKLHPTHRFGKYSDARFETEYRPSLHSEVNLVARLGEENWSDYEVVNVRISSMGNLSMAKPCANCERLIIRPFAPKRLFYSDNEGKFQQMELN